MEITTDSRPGATIAALNGRLDFEAADAAQARLRELVAAAAGAGTGLVLDGSALAYVSSAGLRVFLTIAKEAKAANVRVAVGALQPAVKQVFDISGFSQTKIIDVHPTVDAAVAAVAG